jgi:hypothetical protein
VLVPGIGFRRRDALATAANLVVERDGRTLVAAVTPDRDGLRLDLTINGLPSELVTKGAGVIVTVTDDAGRRLATRPRWQVGAQFARTADGGTRLHYVDLLGPPVAGTRGLRLAINGAAGEWRVEIPLVPADIAGADAHEIEASDSRQGVTIVARSVAQSPEQTAIELEAFFDPPAFEGDGPAQRWITGLADHAQFGRLGDESLVLRSDDVRYREKGQPLVEPTARTYRETAFFEAVPPDRAIATLEIPHVLMQERTEESLTLGVPSETDVSIAGCSARISVTRVEDDARGRRVRIQVRPLDVDAARQVVYLQSVDTGQGPMGTIGTSVIRCAGQRPLVEVPDPSGQLATVTLRGPVIELRGPWRIEIPLAPVPGPSR